MVLRQTSIVAVRPARSVGSVKRVRQELIVPRPNVKIIVVVSAMWAHLAHVMRVDLAVAQPGVMAHVAVLLLRFLLALIASVNLCVREWILTIKVNLAVAHAHLSAKVVSCVAQTMIVSLR